MKISRNEQGFLVIEAIGTNELDEEGMESIVYPPRKDIESGSIRMTLDPSLEREVYVTLHQVDKTMEELLVEASEELQLRTYELDYSKKRIEQLCRQIDALGREIDGSPVVLDVDDRSHPQWSLSIGKARELLESKRFTEILNKELEAKTQWWIKRSSRDARRALVAEEKLASVNRIATTDNYVVGEPNDPAVVARLIQQDLLAAIVSSKPFPGRSLDGQWMQTVSGKAFWPLDPTAEDIDILDIAHALANTCRFGGHTQPFYSVAQHCVLASQIVPPEDARWALLHDAAEAYIGDLIRPIKHSPMAEWFRGMEDDIMRCVCDRFELPYEQPKSVDDADLRMLGTERRDLMAEPPRPWKWVGEPMDAKIVPWSPAEAKQKFLIRAMQLGIKIDTEVSDGQT